MVTSERRPQRRDVARNRARLLAAADKLIAEHGIDLSLNAVAHEAGVGVGTVYRHFTDRDEVVSALLEQRVDAVVDVLREASVVDDPVAGLRSAVLGVCAMQARDRGVWELLAAGGTAAQRHNVRDRVLPLVGTLVERAQATGRVRADLTGSDLPVLLWMGGALTTYVGHVAPTLWRRYVEVMLDGFAARPDPASAPLPEAALTLEQIDTVMQTWRP